MPNDQAIEIATRCFSFNVTTSYHWFIRSIFKFQLPTIKIGHVADFLSAFNDCDVDYSEGLFQNLLQLGKSVDETTMVKYVIALSKVLIKLNISNRMDEGSGTKSVTSNNHVCSTTSYPPDSEDAEPDENIKFLLDQLTRMKFRLFSDFSLPLEQIAVLCEFIVMLYTKFEIKKLNLLMQIVIMNPGMLEGFWGIIEKFDCYKIEKGHYQRLLGKHFEQRP